MALHALDGLERYDADAIFPLIDEKEVKALGLTREKLDRFLKTVVRPSMKDYSPRWKRRGA
ncbi:MAG: hypothetical protein HY248_04135 [Fimbriimonas ginsengisoli]|uniref:Uncharacterized protein n=1 Tax=Fimbriimonas ginsengisoli TaxID=1005039 RepID=A0A931LVT2_FIMGI|nr:hypothetical protein [Fimbriimonas ginsengisoli]MBI3721721.1 hypothetical protein [Fimbriimonas ginsengisoli]